MNGEVGLRQGSLGVRGRGGECVLGGGSGGWAGVMMEEQDRIGGLLGAGPEVGGRRRDGPRSEAGCVSGYISREVMCSCTVCLEDVSASATK
jgi:hypothetical protein